MTPLAAYLREVEAQDWREDEAWVTVRTLVQLVRELSEVLDKYAAVYRRLGEQSAYAKLDSDVWYAITRAKASHLQALARAEQVAKEQS